MQLLWSKSNLLVDPKDKNHESYFLTGINPILYWQLLNIEYVVQ